MDNKKVGLLAVGLCLMMVATSLSGCVNQEKKEMEVKNPNTFVEYTFGDAKTLDPAVAYDSASIDMIDQVYEGLVKYKGNDTSQVYPCLAESWSHSSDYKVWTFHLRHGVKFSNGNDFTAADVKYSFDRVLTMAGPGTGVDWILSQCMDKNSTKVIDDYTVEVNLTKPYGGKAFLFLLAFSVGYIVDEETVELHGGVVADTENDWMKENAVGTGPYKLDHWTHKTEIVLTKNDNYWGGWEGKHVTQIVYKLVDEALTRVLALKNGDADFAAIPTENIVDVENTSGIELITGPSYNVVLALFQTNNTKDGTDSFMSDPTVRRALSYAFNYTYAINDVYKGYLIRLPGSIPKGMPYYETQNNGVPKYNFDLKKTEDLLDAAGYTKNDNGYRFDGKTLHIYYNAGNTMRFKMAQEFSSDLYSIGIISQVIGENWPQYLSRMFDTSNWDIMFLGWMPDYNDPDDYVFPFQGSKAISGDTFNTNWANGTVDTLIMNAKSEGDSLKRSDFYGQIYDIYINDPNMIFVGQNVQLHFQRDWVHGYTYNPCINRYYYDYWKE